MKRLLLLLALAGCAPAAEAPTSRVPKAEDPAATARLEEETLRDLSALDRRFAMRAHVEPTEADLRRVTMGALLAEDPSLAVVNGAIDPFSFEARARGLQVVQGKVRDSHDELLVRLVDEESARLAEDRALPRSASTLVRAVVATWQTPRTPEEGADRDRWLARRLEEVLASIGQGLDVGRARELDDSLDALEHLMDASALARSTATLVRLREALEQQGNRPRSPAASDWETASKSIKAHLGLALTPDEWEKRLDDVEAQLLKDTESAIEAAHAPSDAIEREATARMFSVQTCSPRGEGLRALEPGPERTAVATVRCLVGAASDEVSRAIALMVAHDQVTVARWALDVESGKTTIAETTAKHRPRSRPRPDFTARWERIALSQPTRALGGGYAAVTLYGGDPWARARAWVALGDVPLDIAERELAKVAR